MFCMFLALFQWLKNVHFSLITQTLFLKNTYKYIHAAHIIVAQFVLITV